MSRFGSWLPFLAITLLALLFACDSQEDDQPPGIILGKSIAGIEIGMDSIEVKNRLGEPDEIVQGDFPGVIYLYTTGEFAGLEIEYSGLPEFGSGVASVCASKPYDGQTGSGWGLGSQFAVPRAELADSMYSYGISGPFWAELLGEEQFPATYFYNFGQTVLELGLLLDSEEQAGDLSPIALAKICMEKRPVDRDWGDVAVHPGKYFPSEPGITSLFVDHCLHVSTFTGQWRLECFNDVRPEQDIPTKFTQPGIRVTVSGYQAPKSVSLFEWHRILVVNTIRERKP